MADRSPPEPAERSPPHRKVPGTFLTEERWQGPFAV